MEPTSCTIEGAVVYLIYSKVIGVSKKEHLKRQWMENNETKSKYEDLGWFILLEGSHEWLYVGGEKPELQPHDEVEIRITRKPYVIKHPAPPSSPTDYR